MSGAGTSTSGLAPERRRVQDAVRLASHNASSALVRMLAPLQARADDEARTVLRRGVQNSR